MTDCFEKLITLRRSVYKLGTEITSSAAEISGWIQDCLLQYPTPFNSQSGRIALLFGASHHQVWDITVDALKKVTPPEQFSKTQNKINAFAAGFGTVLFFINDNATHDLQSRFPLYADKFPVWAEQANGILQFMVWSILAEHGIGASLQHYNPLIDADIRTKFDIPSNWRLTAQMPFGSVQEKPDPKTFLPLEERFKILGL